MKVFLPEFLGGRQSGLQASILSGSVQVFAVQVVGLSLALALNIIWVRVLGPRDFGHYSFALSWVNILAVLGSMGWGTAVVRLIPKFRVEERLGELSGLMVGALATSAAGAMAIWGVYFVVVPRFYPGVPDLFHAITGALIIPVSLLLVASGIVKGFKNVVAAQFVHLVVRTLVMLGLVGLYGAASARQFSAVTGLVINLAASLVSLVVLLVFIRKFSRRYLAEFSREYNFRQWFRYSFPLLLIIGFNVLNNRVGILATGFYMSPESTGKYAACAQVSLLAGFGLLVVGMVAQPILSELFSQRNFEQISLTLKLTARGALLVTIPLAIGILVGGKWLLSFMSETYSEAFPILVVLTCGQIFSVLAGQVGTLLVMTDMQQKAMIILGLSCLFHVVLLYFLVPIYGMMGAAASAVITTIFWNTIMTVVVWRKFHLRATAI